jgi:ribosomal protein L40E
MSTTRPRLKLDEQSFQGLLAAAFTIQEHNDKRRTVAGESESVPALRTLLESLCPHCATPLPEKETRCPQCGLDQFRPGERTQHKYASLWEMSREHGVRHDTGMMSLLQGRFSGLSAGTEAHTKPFPVGV